MKDEIEIEIEMNLDLWESVEKTDPNHTKQANVKGNRITAISPQYQIYNATHKFGTYGKTWGFKSITIDYDLVGHGLILFKGVFFFPNGEFPIISSIGLWKDNAKTKIDDDFAKKVETDALTKALSKLGFNADIFMGRYDDVKYLDQVKEEFKKPIEKKVLGAEQAVSNAKNKKPLATMMLEFEMTADQQTKYINLLNGNSKS